LKLEVGTSWVICTKGGGLVSMNEIFTVVCSIVESAFEDCLSADDGTNKK